MFLFLSANALVQALSTYSEVSLIDATANAQKAHFEIQVVSTSPLYDEDNWIGSNIAKLNMSFDVSNGIVSLDGTALKLGLNNIALATSVDQEFPESANASCQTLLDENLKQATVHVSVNATKMLHFDEESNEIVTRYLITERVYQVDGIVVHQVLAEGYEITGQLIDVYPNGTVVYSDPCYMMLNDIPCPDMIENMKLVGLKLYKTFSAVKGLVIAIATLMFMMMVFVSRKIYSWFTARKCVKVQEKYFLLQPEEVEFVFEKRGGNEKLDV